MKIMAPESSLWFVIPGAICAGQANILIGELFQSIVANHATKKSGSSLLEPWDILMAACEPKQLAMIIGGLIVSGVLFHYSIKKFGHI